MGGMWCWDQQSCQLRMQDAGFQTSSKGWQKSLSIGAGVGGVSGVFNSQDGSNPWANANKVYGKLPPSAPPTVLPLFPALSKRTTAPAALPPFHLRLPRARAGRRPPRRLPSSLLPR